MYLMVPAAAMCNYVFILPVGTAPNALAFEMAKWKLSDTVSEITVPFVACFVCLFFFYGTDHG